MRISQDLRKLTADRFQSCHAFSRFSTKDLRTSRDDASGFFQVKENLGFNFFSGFKLHPSEYEKGNKPLRSDCRLKLKDYDRVLSQITKRSSIPRGGPYWN